MSNSTKTVQRTGKTALVLVSVLAVFLLTNCENFMNGNNSFLQNLESQISVANAPVITVRLQPVQNSGTTVPAPGDISFKLNVVKQLEFTVNTDSHVFDHWAAFDKTAYDASARIELTDTVTFSEAKNPKTNATVIKNIANILIVPVCLPHPVVTLKAEAGTGTISPTAPITAKVGSAYDIEFLPNESTYVFDHWAVYDKTEYEAGKKVELTDKIEFVNSKNPKTKITVLDYFYNLLIVPVCFEHPILTIETPEETGTITPSGEKVLEINEPFSITMRCSENYSFVRWAAYIVSGTEEVETDIALIFADAITTTDLSSSTVIATLIERRSDIVIRPILLRRPSVTFETMPNSGVITPAGEKLVNLNDPMPVSMTCSNSHGFIRWAAYIKDGETYTETDAVTFSQPVTAPNLASSTVYAALTQNLENVVIRPICAQRPSVRITLPSQGEKNVYRNTAIYIDFTKPLPVNTFDGFNNLTIIGTTNVTSEDPFYESYEKYYEEPVLSQSRQRLILRSATASGNEQLPRYASVSVTISSDVLDDFNIPMGTDYTLTFTAGKDGDTEPPAFEDIIVSRDASSDAFLSESDLNAVPPGLTLNPFIQNRAKNTVYIGIKADAPSPDNTDYITSFTLTETLVYTAESGQIASNKNKLPVSLDPDDNGYVWFTYTIANAANIDSGIVQLQIQATDSNSNITPIEEYSTNKSNSYLIFFDQTPPNVTGTNLTSIPLLAGATAAGWYNGESKKIITIPAAGAGVIKDTEVDSTIRLHSTDVFWQFSLNGTLWTEFTSVQTEASLNVKELFTGEVELENQPIYVRLKDDMGNLSAIGTLPSTHSYNVDTKSPPSPVITKTDTNPWAFADIPNAKYWIKSAGTISYELTLSGTDTSGIAGYLLDTRTGTPRTGTTFTVGTGGNIEAYGLHTIYSVDGAGNISEEGTPFYTFEDVTPPEFTSMKLSTTSAGPTVYPNDTTLDAHNRMYWTQNDTLTFTLGMTDGGSDPSGVYGYATILDGSDAQTGTTITLGSSDFNNDDPLLTEYTVYAVDNVKNVSTAKSVMIVKDTTAPVFGTLTASGSKGLTHEGIGYVNIADDHKVNAVIDFTEARSGVRDIQFNNTICSSLTDITVRNNGAELVLNNDYEIIGKAIRFTPPLTTASITIEGITVSTGDGEKNLGPALADAVNNQSDKGNLTFKVDTVRPTVALTATGTTPGINSYWNGVSTYFIRTAGTGSITELTLTPIGSDANGGSILGYKTSTGASPTATVNAGVGNNQTLYSVDLARNDSNPLAFSVVADTTPPEKPVLSTGTRYFIKDGYLYHKSNVSVTYTLTSEDSGSGIYGFTSTGVGTLSGNEFTVDSGSIILTAKDNVGNTATLSLTGVPDTTYPIILDEDGKDTLLKGNKNDGTPPEQTGYSSDNTVDAVIHFSNENNEANSAGVRFIRFLNSGTGEYLKVTDETRVLDGNGNPIDSQIWVNDIELKLTTSIHKSPITVKNLTIANTSGDGYYEPQIQYIADAVENLATQSLPVEITIDTTPPEITGISITPTGNIKEAGGIYYYNDIDGNPTTTDTVPISLSMSDNYDVYGYSLNGAAAAAGTSLNYPVSAVDTTETLVFKAVDKAGNLSTESQTIKVRKDTTEPTSTISLYGTNGGNDYINIEDGNKVNALINFTRENVGIKTLTFTGITTADQAGVEYSSDGGISYSTVTEASISGHVITLPASSNYTTGIFRVTGLSINGAVEGSKPISVILTDTIGNEQETAATDEIILDKTPPTITRITAKKPEDSNKSTYDGSVNKDWDNYRSGAHFYTSKPRIRVGISSGVYSPSETLQGFRVKSTAEGTISTSIYATYDFWIVDNYGGQPRDNISGKTQYLYAVDLAGNISTVEFFFDAGADTTPPELSFDALSPTIGIYPTTTPVGSGETYYSRSGTLSFPLTMSDAGSGLYGYKINEGSSVTSPIDTSDATPADSPKEISLNGSEGGTGILNYIYAVDNVGNLSTPAKTVRVIKDITPPSLAVRLSFTTGVSPKTPTNQDIDSGTTYYVGSDVESLAVKLTMSDAVSGTQGYVRRNTSLEAAFTDGTVTPAASGEEITLALGSNYIYAVDKVGNVNADFIINLAQDAALPTLSLSISGGEEFSPTVSSHSLKINVSDVDGSGVYKANLSGANFSAAVINPTVTGASITAKGADSIELELPLIKDAADVTLTGITLTPSAGVETISGTVFDHVDNESLPASDTISIDTTPPTLAFGTVTSPNSYPASGSTPGTGDTVYVKSGNFTLNVTLADPNGTIKSGVYGWITSTTALASPLSSLSGATEDTDGSSSISISDSEGDSDGTTHFIYAVDNAGNLSDAQTLIVKTHTDHPTNVSMTLSGNTSGAAGYVNGTDENKAKAEITFTKATVGVTKLAFSGAGLESIADAGVNDGTSDLTLNTHYTITDNIITLNTPLTGTDKTITVSGITVTGTTTADDGIKEISVQLTDAIGNTIKGVTTDTTDSFDLQEIVIDTSLPSASTFTLAGPDAQPGFTHSAVVTAAITTDSITSDVKKITFSGDEDGYASISATDVKVKIAGTELGNDDFDHNENTITLFSQVPASTTIEIAGIVIDGISDGDKDVDIILTDAAGNSSGAIVGDVTLDTTAPEVTSGVLNSGSAATTLEIEGIYYTSAESADFDIILSDTNGSYNSDIFGYRIDTNTAVSSVLNPTISLTAGTTLTTYNIYAVDKAGNNSSSFEIKFIKHTTAPSDVTLTLSGNTSGNADYVNLSDQQKAKAVIEFTKLTVGVNKLVFSGDGLEEITGAEVDGLNSADFTVNNETKTITLVTPVTSTGGATPVPAALTVTGLTVTESENSKSITVQLYDAVGNSDEDSDNDDSIIHDKTGPTIAVTTGAGNVWNTGFKLTLTQAVTGSYAVTPGSLEVYDAISGQISDLTEAGTANKLWVFDAAGNKTTFTYNFVNNDGTWTVENTSTVTENYRTIPRKAIPTPATVGIKTGGGKNAQAFVQSYTYLPAAEYVFGSTTQSNEAGSAAVSKPGTDAAPAVPVSFKQPVQTEQNTLPVNEGISLTTSSGSILFAPETAHPVKDTASSPADIALTNSMYMEESDTKAAIETAFSTPVKSITASEVQEPAPLALVLGLILLLGMGFSASVFAYLMIKKCKKVQ